MNLPAIQTQINELQRANAALRNDLSALEESTEQVIADRNRLQARVDELEVTNKRLVDMLWGQRSERRVPDSQAPMLPGAEDWLAPNAAATQEIIAGEEAQAILDVELIK